MNAPERVASCFRHDYARLVALLTRRFGACHLEAIEDAVQSAMIAALESWPVDGSPVNPVAWLYRVAHNRLVGEMRQRGRRGRILDRYPDRAREVEKDEPVAFLAGEVEDDLLRMLFVCANAAIPRPSRVALALKVLCGFDTRQIAARLFTSEANVYKRLARARERLRERPLDTAELTAAECSQRLPAVHDVLYLLFTEGYLSSRMGAAIRRELCDEAIRLAVLVANHPACRAPESFALVALMQLHMARLPARQDGAGGLLLLEEQDRERWDRERIRLGLSWLARSAEGETFSRFHAEAGIAAEHCLAPSLGETRWDRVVECYDLLERVAPTPIHTLNRVVAIAEWRGPEAGLAVVEGFEPPSWLTRSYLWPAVLADLHQRRGGADAEERSRGYRDAALDRAPTPAVRALLRRRLGSGNRG